MTLPNAEQPRQDTAAAATDRSPRHLAPEGLVRGYLVDPHMGLPWFGGAR